MNRTCLTLLSLFWLMAAALPLSAQFPPGFGDAAPAPAGDVLTIEGAHFEPATVEVGGRATLVVKVKMAPTWHIYSVKADGDYQPTAISLETKGLTIDGDIVEPEPHKEVTGGQRLSYHENSFEFRVPVKFDASLQGDLRVKGLLSYVACDPNACNPPTDSTFRAKVRLGKPAPSAGNGQMTASKPVTFDGKAGFLKGSARLVPANPQPGSEATLELTLEVKDGRWTYSFIDPGTYAQKSVVSLDKSKMGDKAAWFSAVGSPVEPKPKVKEANYGEIVKNYVHQGTVVIRQKLKIADDAKPGTVRLAWNFDYQTCDEAGCLPDLVSFKTPMTIGGGANNTGGGAVTNLQPVLDAVEGLHTRIDGLEDMVTAITPKAPAKAATAPVLTFDDASIKIEDGDIRAAETATLLYSFTSPSKARLGSPQDVFVDWLLPEDEDGNRKSSKRVSDIIATDVASSEDGLTHTITLEVQATDAARSGDETIELSVSAPLILDNGNEFDYELPVAQAGLSYGIPNLWNWVLKAAFAALLALLTPCVFPMIPVTVSFFTKQAEQSHSNPMVMPTVYVLGIIASFVAIGVAFTAAFGSEGAQILATNGYIQGLFGILFVLFALSLFGVFTLQPPAFLMARAGAIQGKDGLVGTLGMGLLFSLTSFTCTAPLVGLILVVAAESGEWIMPVIGMLSFSTVLAFPFFFLALFPRFLKSMPKSGGWMNSVKVTLGFLELAFALKFLGAMDAYFEWGIFTRTSILWMWVIMFIMNGLYLLGTIRFAHDPKVENVGPISGAIAIILIVFGVYLIGGAKGETMPFIVESLMPPEFHSEGESAGEAGLGWANHAAYRDKPELAYEKAKEFGVPVFIDYTGVT